MRWSRTGHRLAMALLAAVCATPLLAGSAAARSDHAHVRSHIYRPAAPAWAPADTDLGPTSPGVSSILIDAASGTVLDEQGADIPRYPASLTKLMTLDIAFQALQAGRMSLDTALPVSLHAAMVEPVKLGLRPGDVITVREAILAMTTMSANDAATALGEYLGGGSEARFGQIMTLRAHALGMAQTAFYNASGLPNPGQVTTARDLAILARDIVDKFPQYQGFFEVQKYDFNGRTIYSNNDMLKIYPGATGMKTGFTDLARHNLVTSANRNGRVLIGVVLHEPSWNRSYYQMTAMLNAGFGGAPDDSTLVANQSPPAADVAGPVFAPRGSAPAPRGPAPALQLAARPDRQPDPDVVTTEWTAQLGVFGGIGSARVEAMRIARMRGLGMPRVARLESHGRTLWKAQLAGLTRSAAYETCGILRARRAGCVVIAPQSDDLAMREDPEG